MPWHSGFLLPNRRSSFLGFAHFVPGFAHFVGSYMHTLQLATNEDKSPRGMKAIQTVLPLLTPSRMKSSLENVSSQQSSVTMFASYRKREENRRFHKSEKERREWEGTEREDSRDRERNG
eukprot:TRINITY_DN19036_c0_g1_i3.p1 TRINITY_DN19036_c0_g1~~TRINITY_DN19036_c0_g1_i3.p1  ORF type:complete len:120 (+),score=21.34 TRINITY_DN19036_c0_g1_i3:113-472(+)